MAWDDIKRKAERLTGKAQASIRELAESDAAKETKRIASETVSKGRATSDKIIQSETFEKAKLTGVEAADRMGEVASQGIRLGKKKWRASTEETNEGNWYIRSANACDGALDAVTGNPDGVSSKVSRGLAAKLGAVGTSAGIFSIASLLGTASTGTAIGTLSGAAFTAASLAWIGGSVAAGAAMLGVATVAGGIGAMFGAAWASKKFIYGEKREPTELEEQERRIVDTCLALSVAFRKQNEAGAAVDAVSANYLCAEALAPLCEELERLQSKVDSWPYMARQRLRRATKTLIELTAALKGFFANRANVTTGIVSVVFLHLLAGDVSNLSSAEAMVLDALRRSNNSLTNASDEQLATYVQGLDPRQLQGLQNNVKGIYHELRFVDNENTDGDSYVAELFEAVNHPGADVRITNLETGEVQEIQLKATDYMSAVREHNNRYESVDVFTTSEIAASADELSFSGFANQELTDDVETVFDELNDYADPSILAGMGTAGLVALARNVRVTLKGRAMTDEERQKLIKDGAVSAGTAGLLSLLLG